MKRFMFLLGAVVLLSASAYGQTGDGATPPNEGICEELRTATPGLYGLCIAYCEALDCELIDETVQCDGPPDPVILDNYNRRRQATDPLMPCADVPGPCCWTENELNDIAPRQPSGPGPDACENNLDVFDLSSKTCTGLNTVSFPGNPCRGVISWHLGGAYVKHNPQSPSRVHPPHCYYARGSYGQLLVRIKPISHEQGELCAAELVARGLDHGGWSCFP